MKLNKGSLFIGAVTLMAQMLSTGIVLADSGSETREYSAENGYKITITSRGNIIGLERPGRPEDVEAAWHREGYVISYVDGAGVIRIVHDVHDSYSADIRPGERDFIQGPFTAPPSQNNIPLDTMVSATAVVDTQDGLLRLKNEITWVAGTGIVHVKMTITNRSDRQSMRVINVKRVAAPVQGSDLDPHEFVIMNNSVVVSRYDKCICPPPIPRPWPPWTITMSGDSPAVVLLARADDDYELQHAEPRDASSSPITGTIAQGVFVFQKNDEIPSLGSNEAVNISYGMLQ